MGEFMESVQSGKTTGPLRRGFNIENWGKIFKKFHETDENDQRIYDAAIIIHAKLENIRAQLKLLAASKISDATKIRAFVAVANNEFITTQNNTKKAFNDLMAGFSGGDIGVLRPEDIVAGVKIKALCGSDCHPDEMIGNIVDGMGVPVRFIMQSAPSLAGNIHMSDVEWRSIICEINLGVLFRFAEDLWDDCLWNTYKITDRDGFKLFAPQDSNAKLGHAIGVVRRDSLVMGYSVQASRIFRSLESHGVAPNIREVKSVSWEGRRQIIKFKKHGEVTRQQEELHALLGYAYIPYYSELFEEPLPSLNGLTLLVVLKAWAVMSRTALLLMDSVIERVESLSLKDELSGSWLSQCVSILQIDAMVQALHTAVGIKPADGKRLIEFFTFRGRAGQEVWDAPFLPVGPKTIAPVFAAIVSPNIRRLVDVWMRQLGIELERRGPAFESHLRLSAQNSIASSRILKGHVTCIKNNYIFKPTSGREEEIDLIFVIGSMVFLVEAKCILEPTEAKGVAMHRKTILNAAEQVERKAKSLSDNRRDFVGDIKRFGIDLVEEFKILPMVVVSTSNHVGVPVRGVPVVDKYILEKFLEGELKDAMINGESLATEKLVRNIFYTDLADAQAQAPGYFLCPPQVRRLLDGVSVRYSPIHSVSSEDWRGEVQTLVCQPSLINLQQST